MKERRISIRVSEEDWKKIKGLAGGRSITVLFNELIRKEVQQMKGEAQAYHEMIRKIDSSDISKMSENLDEIKAKIDEIGPLIWGEIRPLVWKEKEGKPEGNSAVEYLDVIHKMGLETYKKVKDLSGKESGSDNSGKEIIEKLRQQDVTFAHYVSQILTEIQNLKR